MLIRRTPVAARGQRGVTMLEVLITLVIIAFGLLGLAGLNVRVQVQQMETYQRAQAILLLQDITERMKANSTNAVWYLKTYVPATGSADPPPTAHPYGTVDPASDALEDCTNTTTYNTQAKRDVCEWSNALKGAKESSSGTRVGAMVGARGCIDRIQAEDATSGVCRPGIYRITVAWAGMASTVAPVLTCGQGGTGIPSDDTMRRAVSSFITIGLGSCI